MLLLELEYSAATSKVDSCNHEPKFRIFDYASDEEVTQFCGLGVDHGFRKASAA
ncbi:MAG: hypothetical protein OK439_00225 [Thaumarchaeota archaeon]|nr:hypothetical protein [Nitrososphaerota archaeon]